MRSDESGEANPPVTTDRTGEPVVLEAEALWDGTRCHVRGVVEILGGGYLVSPPVSTGADVLDEITRSCAAIARASAARGPLSVRYVLRSGVPRVLSVRRGRSDAAAPARAGGPVAVGRAGRVVVDSAFHLAFARCHRAGELPARGAVLVRARGAALRELLLPLRRLTELGFTVLAEDDLRVLLRRNDIPAGRYTRGAAGEARLVIDLLPGPCPPAPRALRLTSTAVVQLVVQAIETLPRPVSVAA